MDFDAIQKRARADLLISNPLGASDLYLWEHSLRVAYNCIRIAQFDEPALQKPNIEALFAAALYHESPWSKRCREGRIQRLELLLAASQDDDEVTAAQLLRQGLGHMLQGSTLDCAAAAILTRRDRAVSTLEGHILCDADNLEEFGLVSIWPIVRRGAWEGKGIRSAIEVWRRKKEYHFWSARLADSFRFDSARELARQRLQKLEEFISNLAEEALFDDGFALTNIVRELSSGGEQIQA